MSAQVIVWLRLDLRLSDNPALTEAARRGVPVVPLYVWSPEDEEPWSPGTASRWWLHESLRDLGDAFSKVGSRLTLRAGPAEEVLPEVAREVNAGAVFWNRRPEPVLAARDERVERAARAAGLEARSFHDAQLFEPGTIVTGAGSPYRVFTPFWKACLGADVPSKPIPAPRALAAPERWPETSTLASLGLEPASERVAGFRDTWRPGSQGAAERLGSFLVEKLASYPEDRDVLAAEGTSRLSPHLHFGELSIRQVFHAARSLESAGPSGLARGASRFLSEIGWREFSHHVLHHFPRTPIEPLDERYAGFPWRSDEAGLDAWRDGRTGYPVVDAAMRQLRYTGWMHNRARMVVASFLVKHLLQPWTDGARWFWETLADADLANNTMGWQWVAGCGADGAPFFRIFNPVTQGRRFDPGGAYVRRWVPELARLPDRHLHDPWAAPAEVLREAGVKLGGTYPKPIVAHRDARERALAAFAQLTMARRARRHR